ncbi:phage tail tube protein [Vibrio sp. La 4.2.2]|uniref:phage tail tube protein n=1 Tax=Vibrio sp. La 4.2.2 TaxID=2998830 RepID=UPI0022CDC621|nr:phage tail tube protein [Vibrio sp. La 4.2.2]MDA0107825.1 phage tail tube protein [Vibrio sp. La 4.2.2]
MSKYGMIPVAGKGNIVSVLKKSVTIETALSAGEADDANWDHIGYLAGITPVTMTKEVNAEVYLDNPDGYTTKSTGGKDAGDLSFQIGYAPGLAVQQRLVDIYDVSNGEVEKNWYRVKSPTEDPSHYVVNMYYGPMSGLGAPSAIENSADMKRDITVAVEGRPKLAEDFLRSALTRPTSPNMKTNAAS